MKKKEKIREGNFVKIDLGDGTYCIGRLLPAGQIGIYDFIGKNGFDLDEILVIPYIFVVAIYTDAIKNSIFPYLDYRPLLDVDLQSVKPVFTQDLVDIDSCKIYFLDGSTKDVKPEECINLERFSKWEASAIIARVKDYYGGRRNFYTELSKVILSKDDPRYLAPPNALRWDFESQKFHRVDK